MSNTDQSFISFHPPSPIADSSTAFRLLAIAHVSTRGDERIERKRYDQITIERVTKGAGVLHTNGFTGVMEVDDVYFLHQNSDHCYYPDPQQPWSKHFITVTGCLAQTLISYHELDKVACVPQAGVKDLFKRFDRLAQQPRQHSDRYEQLHHKAALLFHELLARLRWRLEQDRQSGTDVVATLKLLLDDAIQEPFRMQQVCDQIGKSESHLIRVFKKAIGQTPYDYLLTRRLEYARFLLTETPLPVKAISYCVQFTDPYYFSNFFKRKIGCSPLAYRRQSRKPASEKITPPQCKINNG